MLCLSARFPTAIANAGEVAVKGCGKFDMYANDMPAGCLLDSQPVDFNYQAQTGRLTVFIPPTTGLQHTIEVVF